MGDDYIEREFDVGLRVPFRIAGPTTAVYAFAEFLSRSPKPSLTHISDWLFERGLEVTFSLPKKADA